MENARYGRQPNPHPGRLKANGLGIQPFCVELMPSHRRTLKKLQNLRQEHRPPLSADQLALARLAFRAIAQLPGSTVYGLSEYLNYSHHGIRPIVGWLKAMGYVRQEKSPKSKAHYWFAAVGLEEFAKRVGR